MPLWLNIVALAVMVVAAVGIGCVLGELILRKKGI